MIFLTIMARKQRSKTKRNGEHRATEAGQGVASLGGEPGPGRCEGPEGRQGSGEERVRGCRPNCQTRKSDAGISSSDSATMSSQHLTTTSRTYSRSSLPHCSILTTPGLNEFMAINHSRCQALSLLSLPAADHRRARLGLVCILHPVPRGPCSAPPRGRRLQEL